MLSAINRVGYSPAFCGTRKLLYVDDERAITSFAPIMLQSKVKCPQGDTLKVDTANSYGEAIEKMETEKYDAGIFDGDLGDGTGIDLAKYAIKNNKIDRDSLIIHSANEKFKGKAEEQPPKGLGIKFVEKKGANFPDLFPLVENILNKNSSAGLDVKV